jgi:hypothetical protein
MIVAGDEKKTAPDETSVGSGSDRIRVSASLAAPVQRNAVAAGEFVNEIWLVEPLANVTGMFQT